MFASLHSVGVKLCCVSGCPWAAGLNCQGFPFVSAKWLAEATGVKALIKDKRQVAEVYCILVDLQGEVKVPWTEMSGWIR